MAIGKDAALAALDEALVESLKQGFVNFVADAAGAGARMSAVDDALERFSKGFRLRLECHARAAAAIEKIMGAANGGK